MRAWDGQECNWNREEIWWEMRLEEKIGVFPISYHDKAFYCFPKSQREAVSDLLGEG